MTDRTLTDEQIEACIDEANRLFNGRRKGLSGQQMSTYDDWKYWLARAVERAIAAAAPAATRAPDYLREIYSYLASVGPQGFADEAFRNVPDSVLPYSVRAEILPPYEAPQA